MKLADWASLAEIVSGVAVVVTLIFLIIGINENTAVTRASSHEALTSNVNDISLAIAQDSELSAIWERYGSNEIAELDSADQYRLVVLLRTFYRAFENAYRANRYGTLGDSEFAQFESGICRHPELLNEHWERVAGVLSEEFLAYIDELCQMD